MKLKSAFFGLVVAVFCLSLGGCKWWGHDDKDTTPASGFEITVYQDGKVAQKVDADSISVEADKVSFHLKVKDHSGNDSGQSQGTWVVKDLGWKPAASDKRYQATLYSGSQAVGSWTVHGFSTDSQSVMLFPADGSEVLRVCGNVVIKEIKAGTSAEASSRVTVTSGNDVVYKVDLSSYLVIAQHLQGTPADGSGSVFIWGSYKVENLKK